jgi:serine/threonine-protein kinase
MGTSEQTATQDPKVVLARGTEVAGYVIDGLIGHGGMGQVYSAVHAVIGKRAAVKVLLPKYASDPTTVERFVKEARAANQIGHRNIVDVFAFGQLEDGRPFMVMELLSGQSLGDRVDAGPLPVAEVLPIVAQIASALAAAHAKGIIHRDLKPDNVFLADVGEGPPQVKLLDFGIAKLIADDTAQTIKTQTGMMMGTPAYMAPEQARGKDIDERVDVYSLGAMMYEMVVGELPFPHDNVVDMLFSHASAPPPRPSEKIAGVPVAIDDLVVALMAKLPADRPPLRSVRSICRGDATPLPIAASQPATGPIAMPAVTPATTQLSRRKRAGLVAVAAAIVGVGAVAAFAIVRSQTDDKTVVAPPPEPAPTPPAIAEPPPPPPVPDKTVAPVPPPPDPVPAVETPAPPDTAAVATPPSKPRRPSKKNEPKPPAATPQAPPVAVDPPKPEPPAPGPPAPEPPKPEPPKPAVDHDGLMLPTIKKKKTSP